MFPTHNFNQSTIECVRAFVKGDLPIADFMDEYQKSDEIVVIFLQPLCMADRLLLRSA